MTARISAATPDIAPAFKWNITDASIAADLLRHEGTPQAVREFAVRCEKLSDYAYWFFLSTLWVSYSGHSDLNLWRALFSAGRSKRKQSLMKPSELEAFGKLPWRVTAYRAHRNGETDWISYTLDPLVAARFAAERGVNNIKQYSVSRSAVLALFLRRGESELLALDKQRAIFVRDIEVRHG